MEIVNMNKKKGPRVLSIVDQSQAAAEKAEKQREGVIFKSGLQAKIKLEMYKSVYAIDGISLYDEGRNSLLSSSMYNQVKTLLQLEKQAVQEDNGVVE